MVDKNENILVEFDYNNITIIDPNKVIDEQGNAKERLVRHEDLVMYANLECKVIPRTKLAVGVASNDAIQTISLASINFLKPGGKTFLDNAYTDEITGKDSIKGEGVNQPVTKAVRNPQNSQDTFLRQSINSNGKPGSVDNGLLGITSISISQNLSFMSTITIKLVDVKGRALFESGDNSPYAAFFNLPYPMFYLTLKGYYGKAVRLPLMLHKFDASFNSFTGNFDITLQFFTYKFTILSELSMGYLLAAPHMYQSRVKIETKQGTASQFVSVEDSVVERGFQKVKEMYSEYKSKGLIPDDFPEITLMQMKDRLELFIKNVMESFTKQNLDPITDIETYDRQLKEYKKGVYLGKGNSWFDKYMDSKNYYVLNDKENTRIYTFKSEYNTEAKREEGITALKGIIAEKNDLLNKNPTVGTNGKYTIDNKTKNVSIPNKITYEIFPKTITSTDDINLVETYRQRKKSKKEPTSAQLTELSAELAKSNQFNAGSIKNKDGSTNPVYTYFVFEGANTFLDLADKMSKDLLAIREEVEVALTEALSKLLQDKNSGIGFVPSIRNVLAVIFANGEAFLRMMDDVHTAAWEQRDNKYRKAVIFDKQIAGASADAILSGDDSNTPVYPWPQLIVETSGENGQEKYEIRYPGDPSIVNRTKGYLFDVWPEIEFVEEFIKGLTERKSPPPNPSENNNEVTDPKRISFDVIEFPVTNEVYGNKEEVKFFYEIYERVLLVSNYSKLSRSNNKTSEGDIITNIIAEAESLNITKSLSNENPFLIQKLKNYGINASNFTIILRQFSNGGTGESWQNFIRGEFNTKYIKNDIKNSSFEFIDVEILNKSLSQPLVSLENEDAAVEIITGSTNTNKFDTTDTFPFTNKQWDKTYLANGTTIIDANATLDTRKVLNYNKNKKVITNFLDTTSTDKIRPITNFNYLNVEVPNIINFKDNLKSFYDTRTFDKQLPTEGNLRYSLSGNVSDLQTTSIFNTPYFVNSIQEGVKNFRNNNQYPFVSSAYYFINSLPLSTLREKYKTYENNVASDLDYIFASFKKYGALHKVPYAWILKIGSVWHRYKKFIEDGVDILDGSWKPFDYTLNFDPVTTANTRNYALIIDGAPIDIVLQKDTTIGSELSSLINVGFYPQLINDFNVFYQGYQIFAGYSDSEIQSGITSGTSVYYVDSAIINEAEGFDPNNNMRDLRLIPWSVTVNEVNQKFTYIMPSHGSDINQTKNECFKNGKLDIEVNSNQAIYDGSVRLFWAAPQYGYFDHTKLTRPTPFDYMKQVFSGQSLQENFSINGTPSKYSKFSEMLSVFQKDILDGFETEFLKFSKSIYDYNDFPPNADETTKSFKNFQMLFRSMMKVPVYTGTTDSEIVDKIQDEQTSNITNKIKAFLNYDVVFKYGNPSSYDRKLFLTFSSLPLTDPYTWESYKSVTPNALPTNGGGVTLANSQSTFNLAWDALYLYVGFSEIPQLAYGNNGSYITDFFVDLDVAFTPDNVKLFAPIIKIYATQKLNQFQPETIPPADPPVTNPPNIVAFATLKNGSTVSVVKTGPFKNAILRNNAGVVLFTSNDSAQPNNQILIDEAIIAVYQTTSANPNDGQYIVELINPAPPSYPQVPNPQSKQGLNAFYEVMTNYLLGVENFQGKIINNLMIKLQKALPDVNNTPESQIESKLDSDQSKVEYWETFKALNDKWISGNDFKNKTLFEDILLLDRASRNIGDKVLIDIFKLKNRLLNINVKASMLTFVQTILVENHFVVMNIPSYVNFYNVQDAVKNPKPKPEGTLEFANTLFGTFLNVDYRDSSAKMVCFYSGKPSEQLDLKNNVDFRYRNDAFDLRRSSDNPLVENQINKNDWDKSNKVVGFNIDIGPQNQGVFKSFTVSQNAGQATAESLQINNDMANQGGGRGGSTQNVSLYNLYKNRSYECSVAMLGNALIQPTMYFNLRYVPMFSGPYMITSVNHTITTSDFETTFTGIRQPTASLPKIDKFLQSLRNNLLKPVLEKNKKAKTSETKDAKGNVISEKDKVTSNANGGKELVQTQACTTANEYNTYTTLTAPSEKQISLKDGYESIMNLISGLSIADDNKLKYAVYAAMYLESGSSTGFKSYESNYSGVDLSKSWGNSKVYFETSKNYFCLKNDDSGLTLPYAVFESSSKNIEMLLQRWKGRMVNVPNNDAKSISKFLILNSGAEILADNVYTTMDPTQLSNYESKVQTAIDKFNSFNQITTPVTPPEPNPPIFLIEPTYTVSTRPLLESYTIKLNPAADNRKIFNAEMYLLQTSNAPCVDTSGLIDVRDKIINKDTFTMDLQEILNEFGCTTGKPTNDYKGTYNAKFTMYSAPILPNGDRDNTRQDYYRTFLLTFSF
jgi:hypothetical protein